MARRIPRATVATLFTLALTIALNFTLGSLAALADGGPSATNSLTQASGEQRPESNQESWAIAFENDILAGGSRDKDYTYGLNLTYTSAHAPNFWLSPAPLQALIDRQLPFILPDNSGAHRPERHSLELGVYGFTPDNIEQPEPIADDRPYASLVYLASYTEQVDDRTHQSWHSGLSLGILGLNLAGSAQNEVHSWLGNTQARGWDNQISEGGELTARYTLAHQKLLSAPGGQFELKSTTQASIGYLTEASYSLGFRAGNIQSSWWSFDPELTSYGEKSVSQANGLHVSEHYFWGGVAVKARAYNAFLQGQFRHSEVTYRSDELRHLIVEAWLGYTFAFTNGYRLSYVVRGHSSEIKSGLGDRNPLWGGIVVAKSF